MMQNNLIIASQNRLNVAVLFLIFNRPSTTKQVFKAIKKAKPPRLYIAADGARESKEGEKEKVQAVREYVMSHIDWNCEVKTLFQEQNLGCGFAPANAITWFFEHEEMGIILEDDCLPSQSFFGFCEELLYKFKDNRKIWHISGNNFQNGIKRGDADYYFSIYNHIWGWASWADRWKYYDILLKNMSDENFLINVFDEKKSLKYWKAIFFKTQNKLKTKDLSWWDYQWTFTMWYHQGLAILPNTNLIQNIGFGADATHTTGESDVANLKAYELELKNHPKEVKRDFEADEFTRKHIFSNKPFLVRVINKLKRILK